MFRTLPWLVFALFCLHAVFGTADEIFLRYPKQEKGKDGKLIEIKSVKGKLNVEQTNPALLTYTITRGDETIETINVEGISYDREPSEFANIRSAVNAGAFADAANELGRLTAALQNESITLSDAIKQEYDFLQAWLPAKQLLEGSANPNPGQVYKALTDFLRDNPNFYRAYEIQETLGQLMLHVPGTGDKVEKAKPFFGALASAGERSREYSYRGKLLMARAQIRESKAKDALALLTPMIAEKGDNKIMAGQIAQAKVAYAAAIGAEGKLDEAIKLAQQVVEETPSNDFETHARANTVLGNLYLAKQSNTEALLSFLKVELVFPQVSELRAEALAKLAWLWGNIPNAKADRAGEARERLGVMYPHSTWSNWKAR